MKHLFFFIFALCSTLVVAQSTLNSIPNPMENSGYVSNPDRILSQDGKGIITDICAQIEQQDSFQVVFVILESIDGEVPKDFAGELFNKWGVGHKGRDDGLLVLFILDQRRIEFETGYGTETVLTDYQCVQIQEDHMLDFFRAENYTEGLIRGAKALQEALRGKIVDRFEVQTFIEEEILAEEARKKEAKERFQSLMKAILVWHIFGLVLFIIALLLARQANDPYNKYKFIRIFGVWIWAIFFPLTHVFIVLLAKSLKKRYRNMIRFSPKTYEVMRKLSEQDEDEYLSRGQITEELVKSVDYDVWITDNKDDILILTYKPLFTKYTHCPKCDYRTYVKVYDRQIRPPTHVLDGMGQRKHECSNCKHVDIDTYYIRKLSSGSSGYGSSSELGGGGGFGGGFGGGSSGGGGGGGSSGGGGGGSSW